MSAIPRIFHFVYGLKPQTRPFHLVHYLCLESCLRVNRPDRLLFHFHHQPWGEYWDLIRNRITPVRIRRPRLHLRYTDPRIEFYRYAHESDFVRLDVLLEHGGVYADTDTLFVNPVPTRLFEQPFVLGREADVQCQSTGEVRSSVCNAFIMSEPHSEFGRLWRDAMASAFDGSWSRHSTFLPCDLATAHPELVHLEPSRTFYPYMWTREDLRRLLEGCEQVGPDVASIHLWAHLWWSERRRDFSDFHAGLLTESRIRSTESTYQLLARPFLPDPGRPPRSAAGTASDLVRRGAGYAAELPSFVRRRIRKLTPQPQEAAGP